jgi:hypothetical protein
MSPTVERVPWLLKILDFQGFIFTLTNCQLLDFTARWRPGGDMAGVVNPNPGEVA